MANEDVVPSSIPDDGPLPTSDNENRANELASELKGLPMETVEASVRLETARVKLAACAQVVRQRTMLARLRLGRLDCGSALAKVREVLRQWRRGYQRRELKRYATVTRLAMA